MKCTLDDEGKCTKERVQLNYKFCILDVTIIDSGNYNDKDGNGNDRSYLVSVYIRKSLKQKCTKGI